MIEPPWAVFSVAVAKCRSAWIKGEIEIIIKMSQIHKNIYKYFILVIMVTGEHTKLSLALLESFWPIVRRLRIDWIYYYMDKLRDAL